MQVLHSIIYLCGTRVVHPVNDMSASSFLFAFQRFVLRRGPCCAIYSDNALTFKRALKELTELWRTLRHPEVIDHFTSVRIEWHLIIERAPWWGGFYERLMRSAKVSLRKVIGRKCLETKQLATILCEVKAVVISRPLTCVHNEIGKGNILTPASFLLGSLGGG